MTIKTIGAALLAGAVFVGCDKTNAEAEAKAEDTMAISVNGVKLMQSSIDADVAKIVAAQGDKIPAEQLEYAKENIANQIVQSFIFEKTLAEKAKAAGLAVTDEDRKEREAEFLKAIAKMPDAPKSIDEYFQKSPLGAERAREEFENGILIGKLIKTEQAKVSKKDHAAEAKKIIDNIVSNNAVAAAGDDAALKKIKELKAQLDKVPAAELAAKFAEMAKDNSDCPSKDKGGDLGEFTHGQMVKEFDEAAFALPLNKVSEPVKTMFGYHLIMTTKKVPAVEAKDDKPAEPEKVQASHILVKTGKVQEVPKAEDVIKYLENAEKREFMQKFVKEQVDAAKLEASERYARFLPQKTPEQAPVEKPAEK